MNEHTEDLTNEDLANARWENEGGHIVGAVYCPGREYISGGSRSTDAAMAIHLVKASS